MNIRQKETYRNRWTFHSNYDCIHPDLTKQNICYKLVSFFAYINRFFLNTLSIFDKISVVIMFHDYEQWFDYWNSNTTLLCKVVSLVIHRNDIDSYCPCFSKVYNESCQMMVFVRQLLHATVNEISYHKPQNLLFHVYSFINFANSLHHSYLYHILLTFSQNVCFLNIKRYCYQIAKHFIHIKSLPEQ